MAIEKWRLPRVISWAFGLFSHVLFHMQCFGGLFNITPPYSFHDFYVNLGVIFSALCVFFKIEWKRPIKNHKLNFYTTQIEMNNA